MNAIVKSLSLDVPEVVWAVVHPGRVETGLVPGVEEEGAMDVCEVSREIVTLIEQMNEPTSGRFMDRWGKDIPW